MKENVLTLNLVLSNEKIIENINGNIFNNRDELDRVLQSIISFDCSSIKLEAEINERKVSFENTLYHADMYLLESRAFDKETDQLVSSYLQVLDSQGNIIDLEGVHDDVWSTKWELARGSGVPELDTDIMDEVEVEHIKRGIDDDTKFNINGIVKAVTDNFDKIINKI